MQVDPNNNTHLFLTTSSIRSHVAYRKWRHDNPFAPFDRVAFNQCCVAVIAALKIKLAAELASFNARFFEWKKNGARPCLKPTGRQGNVITRMYAKTGWWPLQKNSVLWTEAINTLGPLCAPTQHKLTDKMHAFDDLGDKRIKIRKLVLESFQQDFIDRAHAAEENSKQRMRRKSTRMSIENTYTGKGFCKLELGSCTSIMNHPLK